MDQAREVVRRTVEQILDEWVEISMSLPDTPEKRRINERCAALEKRLLHMDDLAAR